VWGGAEGITWWGDDHWMPDPPLEPEPFPFEADRVYLSGAHHCFTRSGELFCFGLNSEGNLGDGTVNPDPYAFQTEPVKVLNGAYLSIVPEHDFGGGAVIGWECAAPIKTTAPHKALEVDLTQDDPSIEFSAGTFAAATFVGTAPSLELAGFVVDSPRLSVQLLTAAKPTTPAGSTIDVTLSVDLILRRR